MGWSRGSCARSTPSPSHQITQCLRFVRVSGGSWTLGSLKSPAWEGLFVGLFIYVMLGMEPRMVFSIALTTVWQIAQVFVLFPVSLHPCELPKDKHFFSFFFFFFGAFWHLKSRTPFSVSFQILHRSEIISFKIHLGDWSLYLVSHNLMIKWEGTDATDRLIMWCADSGEGLQERGIKRRDGSGP
jgi:hypothetical protein